MIDEAILYTWPTAKFVTRGGMVDRWDGPMACPSDAEIALAVSNYTPAIAKTQTFTTTSRQKDVLATCALIVRAKGLAAWNAMTIAQKKTATLAEADVWVSIRQFIEDNL